MVRESRGSLNIVVLSVIATVIIIRIMYNFSTPYLQPTRMYHQFFNFKFKQEQVQITTQSESDELQNKFSGIKKWIIVTTINHPTEQIKKLSQIPGWQLLVVADKKTPKEWFYPNTTFLDVDTQLGLGYRILKFIPWNAYTRKVIGYLYAIQNGAQFIYDTDDDNAPNDVKRFEQNFIFENTTRGLILENTKDIVVNPYAHFGQPTIWPRGFPLDMIGQTYNNTYTVCPMVTPLIQQGVVNGDPDVDAIFRLTRKQLHSPLNIKFDSSAPPLVLPKSVLTPFNSQNTIFHYDAFWSLVLPISVTFRVTDIWRGYWAQPLLWMIGGHLGFYSSNTTQLRNAHAYLRDFGEEDQLYKQGGDLAKLLSNWTQSPQARDLYSCMIEVTTLMAENNLWKEQEIEYMEAWILDLKSIGYKMPPLRNISSACLQNKPRSFAMFSGVEKGQFDANSTDKDLQNSNDQDHRVHLREFCNSTILDSGSNAGVNSTPLIFPSTLLVVTYNVPHYENIWLLDLIYRPHYPNILYCGQLQNVSLLNDILAREEFTNAKVRKISFVHAEVTNGYFAYECAMRAIDMKYSVTGYLVLSDDVLLNFWNNGKFNPNEMWMMNQFGVLRTDLPVNSTGWQWWGSPFGLTASKCALDEIYKGASHENKYIQQFRANREEFGYNSSVSMLSESDIFYFPESKQEILYEVGWLFRNCSVFLENAVPLLVRGLSAPKNIVHLPGIYLWGWSRENPFNYFNKSSSVIHAVKPSQVITLPKLRREFCDNYLANVFG